jgi:histidine triad (HIT) family protein
LPLLKKITSKLQIALNPSGFNIISNMNEIAYQTIFHFHIHIIPKYENDKGFIWTTRSEPKSNLDWIITSLNRI